MDMIVTAEQLGEVPLFAGLDEADLEAIAERSVKMFVRQGVNLIKKGESGFDFFVILGGNADVIVDGAKVASLGPGDVFGEMALLEHRRRNADVVASTAMILATMMVWDFQQMRHDFPVITERLGSLAETRKS